MRGLFRCGSFLVLLGMYGIALWMRKDEEEGEGFTEADETHRWVCVCVGGVGVGGEREWRVGGGLGVDFTRGGWLGLGDTARGLRQMSPP